MNLTMLKCKIHRATVTAADLHYEGSFSVDPVLMEAAGLISYEKIQVVNINNGARFETYVIEGKRGSGQMQMNGAAARMGAVGDLVIIFAFASMDAEEAKAFKPTCVFVDEHNRIKDIGHDHTGPIVAFA